MENNNSDNAELVIGFVQSKEWLDMLKSYDYFDAVSTLSGYLSIACEQIRDLELRMQSLEKQIIELESENLLNHFNNISKEKKAILRMAYKGSLSGTPLQTWEEALKTNPESPESVVMVSASFLSFYKRTKGVL